ncbi:MAG: HNH endonuclease [Candidatus Pacebacteria bacterium]|nr:HNH endonuclease [Candidatus Paceibacterota bacterium]
MATKGARCERCGYDKKEIINVHHKDWNHGNNNLDNLELLCPNCHAEEHYPKGNRLGKK